MYFNRNKRLVNETFPIARTLQNTSSILLNVDSTTKVYNYKKFSLMNVLIYCKKVKREPASSQCPGDSREDVFF